MDFDKVEREHILQGIRDFEEKGIPQGFGPSSTYDLMYQRKRYPPKAIMAYANLHASGRKIERYFKGGDDTECFQVLRKEGFSIVPKTQNTKLINVKENFASWLLNNAPDSYDQYLGGSTNSIKERLDEISAFFPDFEFFNIDKDKIDQKINEIRLIISKKERSKHPEFIEYDNFHSNGIPKALLGKNNYIKYLEKKFKNTDTPNYWIFQGSPDIYNITNALKAGHLKSWKVAAHKENIKIGDKVIIWQTGNEAGCYALAEVTSNVAVLDEEEFETKHYKIITEDREELRVRLKITDYAADNPVLWKYIKDLQKFENFNAGNQGTNFKATEEEYHYFKKFIIDQDDFLEVSKKYTDAELQTYFDFLDEITSAHNLQIEDQRASFSCASGNINLNIGQRGVWRLTTNRGFKYVIISDTRLNDNAIDFEGSFNHYFNQLHTIDLNTELKQNVLNTISKELERTTRSGYRSAHNISFELAAFNKEYRDQLFPFLSSSSFNRANKMKSSSINQILYGPPGTGKTFYLKDQLFDKYTSKQTSISFEQHFESVVSNCSWWQVIAIALIELGSAKVSDIFENEWVQKKAKLSNSKTVRPGIWSQLQSHTIDECEFVNVSNRQQPFIFNKTEDSYWEILKDQVDELVPELYEIKDSVDNYNPDPDKIIKHYDFVTFHQSFAYEDFIEGIKPIIPETDAEEVKDLGYTIEEGVFKKLCDKAKNDPENRYAIFIDEINRGNVSAIFGELITLIELDKRKGAKNELEIKLPYSKKPFSVPSNLDIYGTMNTADRSVEALDTALRRRFKFKEMMPDLSVIKNIIIENVALSEVLKTINERIELLIDRDHTIGHSYFINATTTEALASAFNDKIVPLLQEYFYGDYGKIGLVLGKGFVEKINNDTIDFASFDYENANDFKSPTFIIRHLTADSIINAVNILLEKKQNKIYN